MLRASPATLLRRRLAQPPSSRFRPAPHASLRPEPSGMALHSTSEAPQGRDAVLQKIDSHNHYHSSGLSASDLLPDPISQFSRWFAEASAPSSPIKEPEAVCVSTSTSDGRVSSRFVLLKRIDPRGLVFFTNYLSRKGRELDENPRAAMAFYWRETHQQVRVVGRTERLSAAETEEYFSTRPVGSRVGAWASPQSQPVASREELQRRVEAIEDRFGVERGSAEREAPSEADLTAQVALPDFWGGIRVIPDEMEFWVGRPNRLHDRFVYTKEAESEGWKIQRLGP